MMKKLNHQLCGAVLLLVASALTCISCSEELGERQGVSQSQKKVWTICIDAGKAENANTRGVYSNDNGVSLKTKWYGTETFTVSYGGNDVGTVTATASETTSTTLVGDLNDAEYAVNGVLTLTPTATVDYSGQTGTLESASSKDFLNATTVTINSVLANNILTTSSATFTRKQSFVKFTFNEAVSTFSINSIGLVDAPLTINAYSPSTTFYVAISNTNISSQKYTFTSGEKIAKKNAAISAGNYYTSSITWVQPVAVDLGLPSGIKWASMNVGAASPADYGYYFAWGEVDGYDEYGTNAKTDYSWSTYRWGSASTLEKYCTNASYGKDGFVDNLTTLAYSDDAARANLGGEWRMPTNSEYQELLNATYTTKEWISNYEGTGIAGCKITSKTNTSRFIFLPASGRRVYSTFENDGYLRGNYASYWTSSLIVNNPNTSANLSFNSDFSDYSTYTTTRLVGFTVRAVQGYRSLINVENNDIGKVICSNGHIHSSSSDVESGANAIAIIAYVGSAGSVDASSTTYKGLALAVSDANNGNTCFWCDKETTCLAPSTNAINDINGIDNTNALISNTEHNHQAAICAVSNNGTLAPEGTSGWFLPTSGQWNLILKGLMNSSVDIQGFPNENDNYKAAAINAKLNSAGLDATSYISTYYYFSNESSSNRVWIYFSGYGDIGTHDEYPAEDNVRSVLAF